MAKFEAVCVAVDSRYDDSMGAYDVAYMFDGESVFTVGGMYSQENVPSHTNCTFEQKREASIKYMETAKESNNFNKYCHNGRGEYTFIGCTVSLKRSRKAPNNTPLEVVDFIEGGYNGRYNETDKVEVTDGVSSWVVSSGCIEKVIKGVKETPFWYVSGSDVEATKEAERKHTEEEICLVWDRAHTINNMVDKVNKNKDTLSSEDYFKAISIVTSL